MLDAAPDASNIVKYEQEKDAGGPRLLLDGYFGISKMTIVNTGTKEPPMTPCGTIIHLPPRMAIIWDVLERAKDAGDEFVTGCCRRLIAADRIGWRKHADARDYQVVLAFCAA